MIGYQNIIPIIVYLILAFYLVYLFDIRPGNVLMGIFIYAFLITYVAFVSPSTAWLLIALPSLIVGLILFFFLNIGEPKREGYQGLIIPMVYMLGPLTISLLYLRKH